MFDAKLITKINNFSLRISSIPLCSPARENHRAPLQQEEHK